MIKTPLRWDDSEPEISSRGRSILDADGQSIAGRIDVYDEMIASINAFHGAGIDPADLPKIVDALKAWNEYDDEADGRDKAWHEVVFKVNAAAARLPRNRT